MHFFMMIAVIVLSEGSRLESEGDFTAAGRAYYGEGDIAGEVRILCRYVEESLYSGNTLHAFDLVSQLENMPLERGCIDFWYARIAWSCGLSEYAIESLSSLNAGPWLKARASGLSAQFRGDAEEAVLLLSGSMDLASSRRQKFYSALDLSFALVSAGRFEEASEIAALLADGFPGEGLPLVALALSMHAQGDYGRAMSVLQNLYSSAGYSFITRHYARSMMEDME
ncbi:MAG: hypothetical protein AVO35_03955 [Candidatus Aegiribacteria sp. MLS_C]|nr:MAG: hypothetical protein AVO35_03955 [Candidatus Aegiribacteria sp. MLS_C]